MAQNQSTIHCIRDYITAVGRSPASPAQVSEILIRLVWFTPVAPPASELLSLSIKAFWTNVCTLCLKRAVQNAFISNPLTRIPSALWDEGY